MADVKKAYRRALIYCHPDKQGPAADDAQIATARAARGRCSCRHGCPTSSLRCLLHVLPTACPACCMSCQAAAVFQIVSTRFSMLKQQAGPNAPCKTLYRRSSSAHAS